MVTTARSTPGGTAMDDGHSCKIAFAADADVSFWEVTVQPPGRDGGDKISTTTMHNSALRTYAPRSLQELTDAQFSCAWDPEVYTQIDDLINNNGWITVHFPNGDTLDFQGYLKSFVPDNLSEGEQPRATGVIVCTNQIDGTEDDYDWTAAA